MTGSACIITKLKWYCFVLKGNNYTIEIQFNPVKIYCFSVHLVWTVNTTVANFLDLVKAGPLLALAPLEHS